jgi:uncharacterized Zn-finger protein
MQFLRPDYKERHLRKMHPEKLEENGYKKFECELCQKYFEYKEALNRHIQEHKGLEWFKCRYCDFKTTWKTSW